MDKQLSKRFEQDDDFLYKSLYAEHQNAFIFLYQQCKQRCIPFALSRGTDETEAEDLLQDCLAIFLVKLRNGAYRWSASTKITTYFYRIYLNQWKKQLDSKRKYPHLRLVENHISDQDDSIIEDDSTRVDSDMLWVESEVSYDSDEREWIFVQLENAFQLLKPDCQKMVNLFYIEEASLRVIAEQLQISEAFAVQKRFRCTKYLTELFHKK